MVDGILYERTQEAQTLLRFMRSHVIRVEVQNMVSSSI